VLPVSRTIDRYDTTFDHDGLIANAGLIMIATLMSRLGLERLVNTWVRTGSFAPGRKICTLVAAMIAGATHIDHVDVLRSGATQTVLPFRVMAPSTIGTFLRTFTFGFVRQLDAVAGRLPANARAAGAGPGGDDLVIDLDSTICEVHGHAKQAPDTGTRNVSATTRSSRPGLAPARSCSHGCAKVPLDHHAGSTGSSMNSPASSNVAKQPGPSVCAPIRGSGHGNYSALSTPTT